MHKVSIAFVDIENVDFILTNKDKMHYYPYCMMCKGTKGRYVRERKRDLTVLPFFNLQLNC